MHLNCTKQPKNELPRKDSEEGENRKSNLSLGRDEGRFKRKSVGVSEWLSGASGVEPAGDGTDKGLIGKDGNQ